MQNINSKRIYRVGSLSRGCDFATLSAAMTALNNAGGWSAANRALIIVQGRAVESATFNPPSFMDVHFVEGGQVVLTGAAQININAATYDGSWTAESNLSPHITCDATSTAAQLLSLNSANGTYRFFKLNVTLTTNAGGNAQPFNAPGAALNLTMADCRFSAFFNAATPTGQVIDFATPTSGNLFAYRCSFDTNSNIGNAGQSLTATYLGCAFRISATGPNPTTGLVNNTGAASLTHTFDFSSIFNQRSGGAGTSRVAYVLGGAGCIHIVRHSWFSAGGNGAGSNSVFSVQAGAAVTATSRFLNNVLKAFNNGVVVVDGTGVAPTNVRMHNNAIKGTFVNWTNQALTLSGSNVVVS